MLKYEGVDLNYSLEGKTAIITGGAAGIGWATAEFFHNKGVNLVLADLNPEVDKLVASRGMRGMLDTIFLIIVAMCFGASMYASGMITDLSRILAPLTRTRTGLVGSTVITGSMMNGIVSDQYLSIILTSNIYRSTFEKEGYENRLLSRAVEDSATVTSPLYPWSSCGMTQATILSVPTLLYAPFCLFNILAPLMSFLVGWIGWKVVRRTPSK